MFTDSRSRVWNKKAGKGKNWSRRSKYDSRGKKNLRIKSKYTKIFKIVVYSKNNARMQQQNKEQEITVERLNYDLWNKDKQK